MLSLLLSVFKLGKCINTFKNLWDIPKLRFRLKSQVFPHFFYPISAQNLEQSLGIFINSCKISETSSHEMHPETDSSNICGASEFFKTIKI